MNMHMSFGYSSFFKLKSSDYTCLGNYLINKKFLTHSVFTIEWITRTRLVNIRLAFIYSSNFK